MFNMILRRYPVSLLLLCGAARRECMHHIESRGRLQQVVNVPGKHMLILRCNNGRKEITLTHVCLVRSLTWHCRLRAVEADSCAKLCCPRELVARGDSTAKLSQHQISER